MEAAYRSPAELRADLARDPILATGAWLVAAGMRTPDELVDDYRERRERVFELAEEAATASSARLGRGGDAAARAANAGVGCRRCTRRRAGVRCAGDARAGDQHDARRRARGASRALLFGEDVAAKGGVYGVTRGLHQRFGAARVFDTLLDETSILGLASARPSAGCCRCPRSSTSPTSTTPRTSCAARRRPLQFFSQGRYRNGMVVRVAGYGYQKGFGGHFHNDNAVGVLRDVPGLVDRVAGAPGRRRGDAPHVRRLGREVDGSVCVFLEPIALYHTRDLHTEGDEGWLARARRRACPDRLGADARRRVRPDDRHLGERPLPVRPCGASSRRARRGRAHRRPALARAAARWTTSSVRRRRPGACSSSTRRAGRAASRGRARRARRRGLRRARGPRVASRDSFVPLGDAARLVLVSEDEIEAAALELVS